MINIAICDDDKNQITELKKTVIKIFDKLGKNIEVTTFNDGKDLIKFYLLKRNYFDIVFLDIIMDESNGIEVAKEIRRHDSYVNIVMVTYSDQYILDGYDFNAYAYILKPYKEERVNTVLTKIIDKIDSEREKNLCIRNKNNIYKINIINISYLESILRKVKIRCIGGGEYEVYEKLDNLESTLGKCGFIRCHRSFLVNMKYISSIEKNDLILINAEKIPISKKYISKVKGEFIK